MSSSRGAPQRLSPTVSVLIPSHNRVSFLRDCVNSVFAQTFTDWELIVADDGSGAETRGYLETLRADSRVQLLFLPHCGNPGAVRNAAARIARGTWLAFLDSDDSWHPAKLATQLAALRAGPRHLWGYTAVERIDAGGRVIPDPPGWRGVYPQGHILEEVIRWRMAVPMPSVIVHRDLFERVGGFDVTHPMFEDYDLWIRLARASGASAVETRLACVRLHDEHFSWRGERAWREWIALFERWMPLLREPRLQRALESQCVLCTTYIARQQAYDGRRMAALRTLFKGRPHGWRHACWWSAAWRVGARCLLPPPAGARVRQAGRPASE